MTVLRRSDVCGYLLLLSQLGQSHSTICPIPTSFHKGLPAFITETGSADYVTVGHYYAIQCCADGFDSINWFKKQTTDVWDNYNPSGIGPMSTSLLENDQILSMEKTVTDDAGTYKCVLKNQDGERHRTFTLYVDDCVPLRHGPVVMAPVPTDVTVTSLGGSVTFPCIGYFGCGEDFREATWLVASSNSDDWKPAHTVSDRYDVMKSKRNSEILSANLTVTKVTEDDIGRRFMCLLATPQIVEGQKEVVVRISKGSTVLLEASMYLPVVMVTGFVASCFILVSILLMVKIRKQQQQHKYPVTKTRLSVPLMKNTVLNV